MNLKKMAKAAKLFIGKHDFRNFVKDEQNKNTIRRVRGLVIKSVGSTWLKMLGNKGRLIYIKIYADSFCYRMFGG